MAVSRISLSGLREGLSHTLVILVGGFRSILSEKTTRRYFVFLMFILLLGLFGPNIAPYEETARMRGGDGQLLRASAPSLDHPLGTTDGGYDVLSRVLIGARPTVLAGAIGGTMIISIGLTVGLVSGYIGGRVDSILMRITDLWYSIPMIPFALVLIALFGVGYYTATIVPGLILWRGSARVIRAQTLQIRERPFILAAKGTGASTPYMIYRHILPNVAPMAVLFFALGMGLTIVAMASLSFLGVTSPFMPSWGVIIRNAFNAGMISSAWWWSLPPGLLISSTVVSLFMFGRGYENITETGDFESGDEALTETGGA